MSSNKKMSIEMKKKVYTAIKTITFIFCLAGFVCNSFMIFKQFIGKKTITSQDIEHNKKLAVPSFTLCSLSGYKEKITKHQDLKLNNYLNKTFNLDEILISVITEDSKMTFEQLIENKTFWEVTTTYTRNKGRCHTIRYTKKVLYIKRSYFHNYCKQFLFP